MERERESTRKSFFCLTLEREIQPVGSHQKYLHIYTSQDEHKCTEHMQKTRVRVVSSDFGEIPTDCWVLQLHIKVFEKAKKGFHLVVTNM